MNDHIYNQDIYLKFYVFWIVQTFKQYIHKFIQVIMIKYRIEYDQKEDDFF